MFPTLVLISRACIAASAIALVSAGSSEGREIRAIYIPGPGEPIEKAFLVNPGNSIEIGLPQRNLSDEVRLPNGDLVMAVLPAPPAEGAEIPAGAPMVRIPEAWKRCLLIFLGDPKNKVFPMRVLPVNASAADFPKGKTLIYNLSSATLQARMGSRNVVLEPGKSKTLDAPRPDFGPYPVAIDCVPAGETVPRAISRSTWQHDPDARQILFVTPQDGMKIPRIWGILDHSEDKPEKDG